jgi:hypothetical protein
MSNAVGCGFEPRSGQTKNYEISICSFSTKHATLRRKSKDWLIQNRDNVSECGDVSIHEHHTRGEHTNHYTTNDLPHSR